MTPEARKKQLEKMQKTTAGKAGKALQDMYNKKKKKKKKKKSGLFDRLREMGRNITSTLTAPQRRVKEQKLEQRAERSGIKNQSGESRMRKGKLYEDAPKGSGGKVGVDKNAPPMSRRKASGEDKFAPKGAGGKATGKDRFAPMGSGGKAKGDKFAPRGAGGKAQGVDKFAPKGEGGKAQAKLKEPSTFKEAFRMARKEGKGKFTFKGKSYAAVTMDEVRKAKKQGKIEKATLAAYLRMKRKK
jgi:hypothetical protein